MSIIEKEEFEKMKDVKGQVRGMTLRGFRDFVTEKEGKEGLEKFNKLVVNLGFPEKIEMTKFYSVAFHILAMEATIRLFGYNKDDFREAGRFIVKTSLIIRLFSKFFFSIEKMKKHGPRIWKKTYTIGSVDLVEYNKEKKFVVIDVKDFKLHPLHGQTLIGYFATVLQMIGGKRAEGKEIKSPFKGDDRYRFLMTW